MAETGEELNQSVDFNVSGAEKIAGATALLQDFSGALQQLVSNPLGGAYAMNRIAHGFEKAFVDPLKKTKKLTEEQRLEFEKLIAISRTRLSTVGFIAGLALGMTEVIRKTKIASAELGKFMSLNQLPGGATNLYDAQLQMQEKFIEKSLAYNEGYSKEYEQLYKELRRKIMADIVPAGATEEEAARIKQDAEPQIEALIEQLTTLQKGTGVSFLGFAELRDNLKSFGIDIKDVTQLYKLLTTEIMKGEELSGFTPREAFETFMPAVLNRGGTAPREAIDQALTLMQTYSDQAGPAQIQQLLRIIPAFQNELRTGTTAQMLFPGLNTKSIEGPAGGVNIINAIAKKVHEMTSTLSKEGEPVTPENILKLWRQQPGGTALLQSVGIEKDLLQLINSLEEVDDINTSIADKYKEWEVNKNLLNDSKDIKDVITEINKGLEQSNDIFTMISESFRWVTTQMQKGFRELGIEAPPWALQAGILGVSTAASIKYGPVALRAFLNTVRTAAIPTTQAVGTGARFVPWGMEGAALTTGTKLLPKLAKGGGIVLGGIAEAVDIAMTETENMQKRGKSVEDNKGEAIGRGVINVLTKNALTEGANIGLSIGRVLKGENIWKAFVTDRWDVANPLKDAIFGKGTLGEQNVPGFVGALPDISSFTGANVKKSVEDDATKETDKDIGNLRIIISNDAGDVLANTTLRDAQQQEAIRIVMKGVSEA